MPHVDEGSWTPVLVNAIPAADAYPLGTSVVVPRPIALISTLSKSGQQNLAPYSYFQIVCHDPFTVVRAGKAC
jgi:flavin reductase (DIM6/NTAB) family NADH-FMN oxidoreductase RutF